MYKLEKDKITYFNNDVMVVNKADFPFDISCVVDDDGYKLLMALPHLKSVEISSGVVLVNGKTKIAILNATLPDFSDATDNEITVNGSVLKNASKFVSDNSNRPILRGVFVGRTGTVLATDSFKLYGYDCGECDGIVLSEELVKELVDADSDFVLKYNNRFACAEFDEFIIYGRLLQGDFPRIFKLLSISGNVYSFDYEKLKKTLEIGSLTKARVIEIADNKIKFEGEVNTFVDDTDLNITVKLSFNSLKSALAVHNFDKLYYTDAGKPVLFENDKEKVLLVGMR